MLRALVAADDVIVQHGLDIPALLFGHFGKVMAAVQALLFARHGQKNNRLRKLQRAQDPRAFQADGRSAGVVVRAGSVALRVKDVAVTRIVVSGDQHDAFRVLRVRTFQDRINILDFGG